MNHRERIERTINREKVDHLPVSFWRHFPVDDQSADTLARATIAYQEQFCFDFVKVSPSSSFCLQDWGLKDIWKGNPEGTRDYLAPVIKKPEDWLSLEILDPKKGRLGEQLECLKLIKSKLDPNTPFIQTIFSPLAQAKNLAGKTDLQYYIRRYPEQIQAGLEVITKTTSRFIEECHKIGVDGLFFAVQFATFDLLSKEEFLLFGKKYDSKLFAQMSEFWLNLLHIHGSNIMFDEVSEYPVQIFNWHDRETCPDLENGLKKTKGAVCGGVGRIETMVLGDPKKIFAEIEDAVLQTSGKGLILGTGCVLPQTAPMGNILAALDYAHSISGSNV